MYRLNVPNVKAQRISIKLFLKLGKTAAKKHKMLKEVFIVDALELTQT
jgi:hypothetical protein